jgi:hypothetical protein
MLYNARSCFFIKFSLSSLFQPENFAARIAMMRRMCACLLLLAAASSGQDIQFGGIQDEAATTEAEVGLRLGLLASSLGVDPLASGGGGGGSRQPGEGLANFQQAQQPQQQQTQQQPAGGRAAQQCCCMSQEEQCGDALGREDLSGSGVIDPRVKGGEEAGISIRVVNRPPPPNSKEDITTCPAGLKVCCYDQGKLVLYIFSILYIHSYRI